MPINKDIFRSYDIRGVYPDELNEEAAELVGKGLGSIFISKKIKTVVVGREIRPSSVNLSKSLIKGLLSTGCNVLDVGVVTTPMIHFFCCTQDVDAGVMITASHNPIKFNGIKIDYKNAMPFYGDEILGLWAFIERGTFLKGKGILKKKDLSKEYIKYFEDKFSFKNNLKVLIDCGGGTTCTVVKDIFKFKNVKFRLDNTEIDPLFTGGVPNPEDPHFVEALINNVKTGKFDVGITFDNDGDRMGVVDEKGIMHTPDRMLLLFAKYVLKTNKGKRVLSDIKSTGISESVIAGFGGIPEVFPTGRSRFLKEVISGKAILGAEFSGHTFFGDKHYGFDDALYSALRVIEILDTEKKPLSELMSEFPPRISTPEFKIDCPDSEKFQTMDEIKNYVVSSGNYQKVLTIDGVKAYTSESGWFLIRVSNTTPYLVARVEGIDNKEVENIKDILTTLLARFDLSIK